MAKKTKKADKQDSPLCLIHAADDPWSSSGSALLSVEYKKQQIPC